MHGLKQLEAHLRLGKVAVRVSVARARGSVPREAGAFMIVTDNDLAGTIGGGHLEYRAIGMAREMLAGFKAATSVPQRRARLEAFPLGAELAQCCGGNVTLLFEWMSPEIDLDWIGAALRLADTDQAVVIDLNVNADGQVARSLKTLPRPEEAAPDAHGVRARSDDESPQADGRPAVPGRLAPRVRLERHGEAFRYAEVIRNEDTPLWLYGAGHVGQALVRVLTDTPFAIRWFDERLDPWPRPKDCDPPIERPPDAAALARAAPEGSFHLVMTHSHDLDYRIVRSLLLDGRFGWLGLIGSETKATCFRIRLARDGVADAQIARLVSPIGLEALHGTGKAPAVIAVAVAAQLLLARQAGAAVAAPACKTASLS